MSIDNVELSVEFNLCLLFVFAIIYVSSDNAEPDMPCCLDVSFSFDNVIVLFITKLVSSSLFS